MQLNTAWLALLPNAQHDGTTQQIFEFTSAFQTDNARYLSKVSVLGQCRQNEDDVWFTAQRDPADKNLEGADKQQEDKPQRDPQPEQAGKETPDVSQQPLQESWHGSYTSWQR